MTLEMLQSAKIAATKARDTATKRVLSDMIDACQKASITSKGRVEITEQLVDETLIKYQKTVQEMIDTCPSSYEDKLKQYKADMEIVKQYAPQLITDKETIANRVKEIAGAQGIELVKANRGALMRSISAELKGKADMKIVSAVVGGLLK
jgi:uncharacterized protein YqeY